MGFARENVEIVRVDRRNRGLNPDGSPVAPSAIPWIGRLVFDIPGEANPNIGTYDHYGTMHYGGMTLPGNEVHVAPEDWPFEAITDVTLVDIGTFPILNIPEGTSGDVMVAVRFVEANFNVTTQLAPAIDALMIANPDVNIVGAVVARTGRVAWQRGVATVGGGATSPYPVILSSCMNLDKLIERGEDLQSFELVRRTHNYGVVATIPADVGEGEDPDMIIVVTAHMDSSGLNSPGASDNSSGTVVAVDMGRHLIELTNEDGVIPGNRIEIQLAPVGAHEGGGGTVSVEIAHRIIARGLGGITINMNMDMVMSPSAMANGTLMDAVSMDTWMPANVPGGDAGLRFNLPAYLVIGSITGVAGEVRDPVLADGIVNARIFRFGGSEHVRFNEAPRSIEAASLIIVEDTTGQNNIGTFYHNAMDSMEFEYCYDRLSMSRDLYVRGVLRAIEQEITKRGEFTFVGDELILENSSQLFQTFDRVAGDIVIEGTSIPFVINYPDTSVTIVYPDTLINQDSLEEVPNVVVRNVMASGYGVADHRNTARLENHPHLNRFSTGLVANLNEFCLYDLKEAILYAVANFDPEYDWTAGTVAARQPTATGVIWDAINGEGLTNEEIGVAWIATPVREGANITAPGIYAGVVRVTYLRTGATIYVPITFESAPQTSWIAPPEYVNRNQVPVVDGVRVPRSPLERNTVNLVDRYGQRLWGTPNEYAATRYAEQAFLDAGLEPENVSVMTFNRAELGATAGQRASGFAGRLEFVGEFPDIYGNALPNSAAFPVLDDPTIVDLGTFPNITVPAGISGDIVVAMRTDMVQLQVETHLAPVLLALEEEHDVNIEAVLLARNGDRNLWQANIVMAAQLPGIANVTNPGHEGSPFFPMILLTDYHLEMALERGAQLNLIERYERTDVAAVHAVLPASTDTPDMVIVLTAHMDGVTAAPSVSDNGASVAALIEMARYFVDYDRGNIEIHFLANGGHEVGGMGGLPGGGIIPSLPVQWKIAELEEANLDVVTINMDFNMVVSPMADPQGNPLDALSVGVLNRPVNVDRVDFNLSAHLLLDHASTLWAPGIVNARISNFSGADSEDFTDAGIDAASLAVRGDLTEGMAGGLGREIWYHTAFDNLDRNYCYNRLNMSANVMREALRQAFDQETTRRAEFGVNTAGELVLVNAEQMFQTYDRVEGSLIFEDNVHVFTFERSVGSALVLPGVMLDNLEYLEFGAVVASGYGNPDHNPRRPARNAQWMLDNARFSTSMVPSLSTDIIIPPPDRGDLGDIIDEADLLDREDFTAANWRLFVAAFAHAQNVYDNPEATQAEIDFAIATLRNIMNRAIGG
jgi:Zn-dependent M28 family amino/carboxypeptidase